MDEGLPRILKPFSSAEWERQICAGVAEVVSTTATTEQSLIDALSQDVSVLIADVVTPVPRRVLASAGRLHSVVCFSTGIDYLDLAAATELGIVVSNTPGYSTMAVAEHAIAMMLALCRKLVPADASTRHGQWHRDWAFEGVEVDGKTLGIVGFGHIGQVVARKAAGLGMRVLAYSRRPNLEAAGACGAEVVSLETLLRNSDFVSVHTPLTPETRGLIGREQLSLLKSGARLINCARGGVVDEVALGQALSDGSLAGAALDVFEQEPANRENPLFRLDNVIVTPHIAWHTVEATERAKAIHESALHRVLRGEPPKYIVNPEVLPRWRRRLC